MMSPSIYSYVKSEESRFETEEVRIGDNWSWSFRNHVQMIFHLKNGVFFTGENKFLRAFKNIMEPILNLAHWAEDIEVKDVVFFIENKSGRVLSFLVKKYHDEVFVREHNLDTLFDKIAESDIDYGGVLVQKSKSPLPEVIPLKNIAFCDQTDIMGSPIGLKYNFSPSKLRTMAKRGWGKEENGATISIEELITLADNDKTPTGMEGKGNKTPGKNIEVYIVRGDLPEHYLKDNDNMEDYSYQLHILAFYTAKSGEKEGVTLYRKAEDPEMLKFHTSQEIEDRALGRGEGEALLHPQVWTNFLTIHKTNMLEAGSKVPLYTDDETYTTRNKIQDMENLEITTIGEGKKIYQVPTVAPVNVQLLDNAVNEWLEQGQFVGSAFDPILGKEQVSGTTFRGQERSVQQGRGLHDRRRGQRAKFIECLYREYIIPAMKREILKGKKFIASLSVEEIEWVADQITTNETNRMVIDRILDGKGISQEEIDAYKQLALDNFKKKGNQHLLEILEEDFKDVEIRMGINIAGKQKDLAGLSDKVLSIFQFVIGNPNAQQMMQQVPGLAKAFNDILEYSGISPVDFSMVTNAKMEEMSTVPQPALPPASPVDV